MPGCIYTPRALPKLEGCLLIVRNINEGLVKIDQTERLRFDRRLRHAHR